MLIDKMASEPHSSSKTLHLLRKLKTDSKGQALVEFILVFVLLLVLAYVPADFGLAVYTGQLALNASREGARIAAVELRSSAQTGSCTMPCSSAPAGSILGETAKRISRAPMRHKNDNPRPHGAGARIA